MTLHLKDKKILYCLDQDSRQSLSSIGKKVGLPKTVIAYRINKLIEMGIIKNFYTLIDSSKLGYSKFRFYLTCQYTTPRIKQEIIDYLVKNKTVVVIHLVEGSYDLVVFADVKNIPEFYSFWEHTLDAYGKYFANQIFSLYVQEHIYGYSFLLDEKNVKTKIEMYEGKTNVDIDTLDFQILQAIAPNARMPLTKVAKTLNTTPEVVRYRIKRLIKLGVIRGFKVNIDFSKLGYRLYKVNIVLKEHDKIPYIIDYIKNDPHFICVDKTLGYVDLELEFILPNISTLHEIMEKISVKFPEIIKNYTYFSVINSPKLIYIADK